MKSAMWMVFIFALGVVGIVLINIFGNITTTNQQDYTLIKNTVEASMYDAIDIASYRAGFYLCTNKEDSKTLTFKYTDDELEIAINGIIEQIEDDIFFFDVLCDTLMVEAQNENKIDNATNTVYLSNNLDAKEYERVSIILWKRIWAHGYV